MTRARTKVEILTAAMTWIRDRAGTAREFRTGKLVSPCADCEHIGCVAERALAAAEAAPLLDEAFMEAAGVVDGYEVTRAADEAREWVAKTATPLILAAKPPEVDDPDIAHCRVCGKAFPHPAPGTGGTWTCSDACRMALRCVQCGGPVERERHVYAHPTCYKCLPPPDPLPVAKLPEAATFTPAEAVALAEAFDDSHSQPPEAGGGEPRCPQCGLEMFQYTLQSTAGSESVLACPDCGPMRKPVDPAPAARCIPCGGTGYLAGDGVTAPRCKTCNGTGTAPGKAT